jgi:hypothetical protein
MPVSRSACTCCSVQPPLPLPPAGAGVNERWLWHGAPCGAVHTIARKGFDICRAKPGCAFGDGIYLGERSRTAVSYARRRQEDSGEAAGACIKVILARALLGRQCAGEAGMRWPPGGYDSATGTLKSDTAHVLFENDRVYPSYILTLAAA